MDHKTKEVISGILRWTLAAGLTVALLWVLFRKVNFGDMMEIIRHGVNYWWILAAMGLSVISHMIRARRWQLQLDTLDIHPGYMALCCSIFGCYALNIVFPRLGDIWRCTYIAKREKASFSNVFGSMVSDRLADSMMVLVLFLLTLAVATSAINAFLEKYPVGRDLVALLVSPWLWLAVILCCALALWSYRHWHDSRVVIKIRGLIAELWKGFATVITMRRRGEFILLSVLLWTCYFIQLYVAFFAFPFTRELCAQPALGFGLVPCLVAFVLSSIAMGIPSNGGLGPWNIAIMFGLAIYGVSDAQGTAFSMLQWSGQTLMLIILGLFTVAWILHDSRRRHLMLS
ncbi:MAG: flippase-like domain-containing protein [Muribaculaceae bacterium]|nr:flippase-like domain-containing protein [Muribaculaceae bacterium]